MTVETVSEITVLTPDDGMILKSGYTYSEKVYLGKYDSADNWTEVSANAPREESPEETQKSNESTDFSASDAVNIILGEVTA